MSEVAWQQSNQMALEVELGRLRSILSGTGATASEREVPALNPPSAIDQLVQAFGLSAFERDLLLWCAAVELEADFYQGLGQSPRLSGLPTFGLALSHLPAAHWSALKPESPLRYWHLLEVCDANTLVHSPLRIDESILHYLAGTPQLDEGISQVVERIEPTNDLIQSHRSIKDSILGTWQDAATSGASVPSIQLSGIDHLANQNIAAAACSDRDFRLFRLPVYAIPTHHAEMVRFFRLWNRGVILFQHALLLDTTEASGLEPASQDGLRGALDFAIGAIFLSGPGQVPGSRRAIVTFEVEKPTRVEQRLLWQQFAGHLMTLDQDRLTQLTSQFNLSQKDIKTAITRARGPLRNPPSAEPDDSVQRLWEACRLQARPAEQTPGQLIHPAASWDDLILPADQKQILRDIAAQVRQRHRVYHQWGFAAKSGRDLGISALFAGSSGTGKTMAAEVIANDLKLDLFRVDLSAVVSKYVGETEKQLRRVFDAAEAGGFILLFDEADALFGKRTETRDSQDRYANIEVSYLLQRMEAFQGLAILTTNLKEALDTAFLRRLRFVVHFPFPDFNQRREIWRHVFPKETPSVGLKPEVLAKLNVGGGNIRNIAMNGAFVAAEAGEQVSMRHLLRAARSEYGKQERHLTQVEIEGWV